MKKKIAITKGDGIGPEVVEEGIKILNTISDCTDFQFEFIKAPVGGNAYIKYGDALPEKSIENIKNSDAALFGAVGLPNLPPGVSERAILKLRQDLDLYVNLRPIKLYKALKDRCPLKEEFIGEGIDITFIRENTEGLYAIKDSILEDDFATVAMVYTRKSCERIIKYAFEYAKKKNHIKVTSVDKANVLDPSRLWRKAFHEIGQNYQNIKMEDVYIDAFCQFLIRKPFSYQTVVTGNLFGDIISDEGAFLIGSLGMAASGNINPEKVSIYEPIHGSAPDIAGKGIANPIGTILSIKLMMQESFQSPDVGNEIEKSVEDALLEARTLDIENAALKTLSTREMGNLISGKLESRLKK